MHVVSVRNVHGALPVGLGLLQNEGIDRDSRNGPVRVVDVPVTTMYGSPRERVMFHPGRDANPFFHFFESLWMLAGRNDVKYVAQYAGNMKLYSDNGVNFHGAYGHRWINHFGMDQLAIVAQRLRDNPDDRRCVVQMWDSTADLGFEGKDFPCNTQVYFTRTVDGALDMTVCNRSNDVIWGAYGANAVHFSALQEFMAAWIGCEVGCYWQMSNNYHAYKSVYDPLLRKEMCSDPYSFGEVEPYPMVSTEIKQWREDLAMFLDENVVIGLRDQFFRRVAVPMKMAHRHFKEADGEDKYIGAVQILEQCAASDWQRAATEWIQRRHKNWKKAQDDGPTHE